VLLNTALLTNRLKKWPNIRSGNFRGTRHVSRERLVERWKLTEDVERKAEPRQAEALEEAQGAEHGHVDGEGHGQTEHQQEQHRYDQHRVAAEPAEHGKKKNYELLTPSPGIWFLHSHINVCVCVCGARTYQSARIPNVRYPKMDPTSRENLAMWTFHAESHTRLHCRNK